MAYPKSVYHKDHVPEKATEESLKKHSRVAKSEDDHKSMGPDWGYDAKELKSVSKSDVVEIEAEKELKPKSKFGRK